MGHRRVLSGKGQVLLLEGNMNTTVRKPKDYFPQIVEVAGQPME